MEKAKIEDYINNRLINQRKWYEVKATYSKKRFMNYQKIIILLGAIIPLVVVIDVTFDINIWGIDNLSGLISAIIAAVIAIVAGFDKLQQPQTGWYNFRAAEEILKKEEWLYKYKAGHYSDMEEDVAEKLLVERIESAISSDMARFAQSKKEEKKEDKNKLDESLTDTESIDEDGNKEDVNEEVFG